VLDLYGLAYNVNQQVIQASSALKQNLAVYLSEYKIINDNINIKDAYVINIGVNIDIITLPNYNNDEVLLKCITAMRDYFNIENWQINQPIILRDINVILDRIEGVQTVKNVSIINKVGVSNGYSDFSYDISAATDNNVIYPSLDPMIFEVKYPNTDIQAKVVPF
jgi:acetone carboxylase gamma subunit